MKIKTICALILLMLTASFASAQTITRCGGPTNALQTNWPTFHFDVCRTGNNPYEHILSPNTVGNLALDWQVFGNDSSVAPEPVLVNGVVYAAIGNPGDAILYAFDAKTKNIIWQNAMGATSDPAVANGIVYIGSFAGSFNALNAQTGALIWQYGKELDVDTSPVVADGIVYFSSYPNVYALDARTGALIWQSAVIGVTAQAAVVNGIVYVTSNFVNVDALNARTGALIWQSAAGSDIRGGPAVFNGILYVNSNTGDGTASVFALNALSGAVIWETKLVPDHFYNNSSPAVANGVVYVVGDADVKAFDAHTGAILWTQSLGSAFNSSSPIVANGLVYVGSYFDYIFALDAGTGAVLWQYQETHTNSFGSPIVANGMLFLGSTDKNSGAGVLWAFHLPGQ